MTRRKVKAIGLMSGGLDSTLAAGMLKAQGVDVEGVHFWTGFCKVDHRRALGRPEDRNPASKASTAAHSSPMPYVNVPNS